MWGDRTGLAPAVLRKEFTLGPTPPPIYNEVSPPKYSKHTHDNPGDAHQGQQFADVFVVLLGDFDQALSELFNCLSITCAQWTRTMDPGQRTREGVSRVCSTSSKLTTQSKATNAWAAEPHTAADLHTKQTCQPAAITRMVFSARCSTQKLHARPIHMAKHTCRRLLKRERTARSFFGFFAKNCFGWRWEGVEVTYLLLWLRPGP